MHVAVPLKIIENHPYDFTKTRYFYKTRVRATSRKSPHSDSKLSYQAGSSTYLMKSLLRRLLHRMPGVKRLIKDLMSIIRREPKITYGSISDKSIIALIKKEDPVILDIGCNDGSQTLWFLGLFKKARVYSFEPDPRARERYFAKVKDERAILFDMAISDTNGVRDFYVSSGTPPDEQESPEKSISDWDLSGSIRKPKKHLEINPWCKFDEKIVVNTMTLDSWVKKEGIGMIDFIWADAQGAEADLIAGGKEALRNTRYLYTEYSNTELYEGQVNLNQLLKLLPDFRVVRRYEYDVLLKNGRFE
ncbi:MAG TPA: FkbM family methyltransferase [Candidatus Hodarchaeales archaeon]|nr:FkbM family methyltransferase [Candidatus Hodarchaeales archaeon]